MQRLLVSVRGPLEAVQAARGGAHIADVEYPASALGTPYPLNIRAVRERLRSSGLRKVQVSTNIGERPFDRATACQAALGVAAAGADLIKFGLAEQSLDAAAYLGEALVRTVRKWFPRKRLFPAVFVDEETARYFDPLVDGLDLAEMTHADGLLLDTYNKLIGKGLLDYASLGDIATLARKLHRAGRECWVAGSITREELPKLWSTGVDVVCVRGAACAAESGIGRFGKVTTAVVRDLVSTMHR